MSIFREYGLDKCALSTLFSNVSVLLRGVTLDIYRDAKRSPLWSYLLTYSTIVAYLYVYIFSMLWFVFVRCQATGDLVAASVIFSDGSNSGTCVTKFVFINFCRKTLGELVNRYLVCDARIVPGSRFHINLMKLLRIVKQRAMGIWIALMGITTLYILKPIFMPGRHFPQDLYVVYGLEPKYETPNYEISFFLMVLSLIVGVYEIATAKALVVIMVGYIEAQLLALSQECLCIWDDANRCDEENINDDEININTAKNNDNQAINKRIRIKLKNIIQFHVTNINNLRDFDRFYRLISFADFGLIVSAIIAQLLGKIENTFLGLPYTFLQIYIDCYIGQKLTDAINIFENAVYDCKWENFDPKNKKMVLMLLRSSQKTITITAGGVAPLNYITLMSVIKTTYSAYTTLQSSVS